MPSSVAEHGRVLEFPSSVHHKASPPEATILPTLFGDGYDSYKVRKSTFVLSFLSHLLILVLVVASGRFVVAHRHEIQQQVVALITDVSPYVLPAAASRAGGGGGGGDRSKLAASKGALPRSSREQIAPPAIVVRNENPKLLVAPTIVVPPQIKLPQIGPIGDPLSAVFAPPSNGVGSGSGIGSGSGGGIGSGRGPGVGPGWGGGIGGGAYRVGEGVSGPRVIYSPDPEFSEQARKAKYQGTVVLSLIVGPDGRPHDIRVYRSLGMGLDEKAIEAIQRWKFEPGRKDGIAVAVLVNVEVNFRLY
jgi:periplasmic protein TonB